MSTVIIESTPGAAPAPQPEVVVTTDTWPARTWSAVWPVLLVLLTPVLWLIRCTVVLYTRAWIRVFRDVQISTRTKCPACGVRRQHRLQYSAERRAVQHTCVRCSADWWTACVYAVDRWSPPPAAPRPASPRVQPIAPAAPAAPVLMHDRAG